MAEDRTPRKIGPCEPADESEETQPRRRRERRHHGRDPAEERVTTHDRIPRDDDVRDDLVNRTPSKKLF